MYCHSLHSLLLTGHHYVYQPHGASNLLASVAGNLLYALCLMRASLYPCMFGSVI